MNRNLFLRHNIYYIIVNIIFYIIFLFLGPPKLHQILFPEYVPIGKKVIVVCTAFSGSMPITFTWKKDGKNIQNVPNVLIENNSKDYSALNIGPTQPENVGNYTCIAENNFGKDSSHGTLTLRGKQVNFLLQ